MKWVVLVYIAMFASASDDLRYTRLEFPAKDPWFCMQMARELNDIENAYRSEIPYVRSFYWVFNNLAHKIKAECVYADPPAPAPEWFNKQLY